MNQKLEQLFQKKVQGKIALITGASSGIGLTVAKKLAAAGAHVLLVSRTEETLKEVQAEIQAEGGQADIFPCDLNDMDAIDEVSKQIIASVDHIDILINNAGRSIRRAVHESIDRFHDFERTMQLNYFGAVRLVLNILPQMMMRKDGQKKTPRRNPRILSTLLLSSLCARLCAADTALRAFLCCSWENDTSYISFWSRCLKCVTA